MNTSEVDDRLVADGLTTLRQPAPAGLSGRVLASVGLDEADEYVQVDGPIGPLFVAYGRRGISFVERVDAVGDAGGFEEAFFSTFGRRVRRAQSAPSLVQKIIDARLWGRTSNPSKMSFELDQLPEFERSVLLKVLEIPRGEVRPYAWVAAELGRPLAVRAVGNAVARNPIPFVIPCHRVVRSDGRIGNYGAGGPTAKREVLAAEGVDVDELERLPNRGVRFIGSDTTHIYCYPSCHNAKRITDSHRVPLHSSDEARASGFRACKVCRPVDPPFRAAVA